MSVDTHHLLHEIQSAPHPARPDLATARIIIVDHDAAVRDALSLTLRASGFEVLTYRSGGTLLTTRSFEDHACLLIEFDLEDMTGIELLGCLQTQGIALPGIIMSGRLRPLVLDPPKPRNLVTILQKPFGIDALLAGLRQAGNTP